MGNVFAKQIVVTTDFVALHSASGEHIHGNFEIYARADNSGDVIIRDPQKNEVYWQPSCWHQYIDCNLENVYAKGISGDIVEVHGIIV